MAFASSLFTSVSVPYLKAPRNEGHLCARFRPTHLDFPRHSLRLGISTVACARRKSTHAGASKTKKKRRPSRKERDEEDDDDDEEDEDDDEDEDDEDALEALFQELEKDLKNDASSEDGDDEDMDDDDAFEALFDKLEKDLKNDTSSLDDEDDDITEEDFVKVERELAEAFGSGSDDEEDEEEYEEEEEEEEDDGDDDDDDEEEDGFKLKNWQFRRLASALKAGRRKTGIKDLAVELCLDRAVVLELLRNPPPKLLMYSAILPDFKPIKLVKQVKPKVETEPVETVPAIADVEPQPKVSAPVPIHVRQTRWSAQKGLKKVHAMTLEQVYRKTKRPTNAMVGSIVHVTKLPRKKIVKWFEDKRAEDGVPDKYPTSYQRSAYETESETDSSE